MSQMVRKQIYIEKAQERQLRQKAKEMGVSEAALIRKGIDYIDSGAMITPRDAKAWQDELRFIQKRTKIQARQAKRRWTREDLYEERYKSVSRR